MKTLKQIKKFIGDYLDYRRYGFNRHAAWRKAKVTL